MDTATVPQVQKKEYRNNTSGWVGVVTLDHLGRELGVNIEPNGTMWLSDAEAILTARAPRSPEDNPFLERTYVVPDPQTGERREVRISPITLVSDRTKDMYASDRFVPGIVADEARSAEPPAPPAGVGGPAMTQAHERPTQLGPVPPSSGAQPPPDVAPPHAPASAAVPPMLQGAAGAADSTPEEPASWTDPPPAPGRILPGALTGDDSSPEEPGDPTLSKPGDKVNARVQAAPETVGARLGAEEFAERVDPRVGEETGAARPPTQPQPEGEFAAREEVGSPDAPAQHGVD